jgi:toxin YoeB
MILQFTGQGLEDYNYRKSHNLQKAERIKKLIANILETPFTGIGKPEPLLFDLKGYWSRRIDREHRLVYKVTPDALVIVSCRFH